MFKLQNHGNLFLEKEGSLTGLRWLWRRWFSYDHDKDDDVDLKGDVVQDYDDDYEDDTDINNFYPFFRLKLDLDFWTHPSHVGVSWYMIYIRTSLNLFIENYCKNKFLTGNSLDAWNSTQSDKKLAKVS